MLDLLKKENNVSYTENGAITNVSSFDPCLDFFFEAGALRDAPEERIIRLFEKAFTASPDYSLRTLFYARDIRGGLGERRLFGVLMKWLGQNYPRAVAKNLELIPEYGRWDDIIALMDTPCEDLAIEFIRKTLSADEKAMAEKGKVSLMAKWLPSVNASNVQRKQLAGRLASKLGMSEKVYRRRLSALKGYIDVLERRLCRKDYTFDYEKQPSGAMLKYRRAFMRNDYIRYMDYIRYVRRGKAKIHTETLYPYEIIRIAAIAGYDKDSAEVLDTMWNSLPDYCDGRNAIAVVDGSGSMRGLPSYIATSLGIYFAEHNKGFFHNHFITFSTNPTLVEIRGKDICLKTRHCMSYNEISNTDLIGVFRLILNTAVKNGLSREELPDTVYVISDMEFDAGVCSNISLYEEIKQMFAQAGYRLPNLVYWNVSSRQNQYPVTKGEYGTILVSGASPSTFEMVISGLASPYEYMLSIINSDRYIAIESN